MCVPRANRNAKPVDYAAGVNGRRRHPLAAELSVMLAPSREASRQFFRDAWRKRCAGVPLEPMEALVSDVIAAHPEYHAELAGHALDAPSDNPAHNPFLHMGLHIALGEQLQADHPPGVRAEFARLCASGAERHELEHRVMAVLADVLWEAQRSGRLPDQDLYLARLRAL